MTRSIGVRLNTWYSICQLLKAATKNDIPNYVITSFIPIKSKNIHHLTPLFLAGTVLGDKPHKFISLAPFEVCKDTPHLEKIFQDIMDNGGEGVILRDPECPYQPGRSSGYLKHKVSHPFPSFKTLPGITPFLFFSEIQRCGGKNC